MKFVSLKHVAVLGFVTLLSACGGGGGSSTVAAATVPFGIKQMGVAGKLTSGDATATDASGNVYVTGRTYGGLDGNTLTGISDFFLTKYTANGNKLYTRQMGVSGADTYATGVATDASGSVYVTGGTTGGLDGNTLAGTGDIFLTKYMANGSKLYTRQMGVAGAGAYAAGVATDASGNVYVTGQTTGGLDGNMQTGITDFFLTKFSSGGIKQYTRQMGAAGALTQARSVATDAIGNVYVAGSTQGSLDGNTLTGTTDFFLTKYDVSGNKIYTKQVGLTNLVVSAFSVATDANNNVYVSGWTSGGLNGNTQTGLQDFFLIKYDVNGYMIKTKQMGVAGYSTVAFSVATDANNNVYVSGYTDGGLDGNTLTGLQDFFLTKYDANGNKLYTRQMGVTGYNTNVGGVATDKGSNVYVAGTVDGGLGGNTLTGLSDFFLAKYNSFGVLQ